MKTREQMLKAGSRRIAKRPPGNGKGHAPSGRAATDGTAKVQRTSQNLYDVNAKAKNNTSPGQKGKRARTDGTAGTQ